MTEEVNVLLTPDHTDQRGFFDKETFVEPITVVGVGGVGTGFLCSAAPMGLDNITLYDKDMVERRNVTCQVVYTTADLYKPKLEVCEKYLRDRGATNVETVSEFVTADTPLKGGVVVSGVDNMAARKAIWEAIKRHNEKCKADPTLQTVDLLLDGRIGGLQMSLLAVEPFDSEWYERKWLFSDEEAADLPCGMRTIVFPAVTLGAIMASYLMNWHKGQLPPKRVDFHLGTLFFQTVGKRD